VKTYYIVEHPNQPRFTESGYGTVWWAHEDGLLARLNSFGVLNCVIGSSSVISADDCEANLREAIKRGQMDRTPRVVRVVKI